MPKAMKDVKTRILTAQESAYMLMPWSCNVHPTFSEIEAYLPITGNFEIVADIHNTKGVDAEVVAGLITRAVNSYEKLRELINQMAAALELCLTCADCLSWEAEHEALAVLKKHLLAIDGRAGTSG
jgi:hypothetical protein